MSCGFERAHRWREDSTCFNRRAQISDIYRYVAMERQREKEKQKEKEKERKERKRERERYESWPAEPHAMLSLLRFLSVKSPGSE